jgi:serine/threonine protein kinase
MEYLEGEDLEHRVQRAGRLAIENVVHITRQVASALAAAHDQGVVHRDLKPANIFLLQAHGEPDFVKVLDFGVSKIKAARTKLTRTSAVIGTPNYMSPEQAMGMVEEVDHRADQWALACIAWEMLLGRPPFVADDIGALLFQVINVEPRSLAKYVPGLPLQVETVLRRALSKRSTGRFPSISEFGQAFELAGMLHPHPTPPSSPSSSNPATKATIVSGTPTRVPEKDRQIGMANTQLAGEETFDNQANNPLSPTPSREGGQLPAFVTDAKVLTAFDGASHPQRRRYWVFGSLATVAVLVGVFLSMRGGRSVGVKTTKLTPSSPSPVAKPKVTSGKFTVKYTPSDNWEIGNLEKMDIVPKLLDILNKKHSFSMDEDLPVIYKACGEGEKNASYVPKEHAITVCYELVNYFDKGFRKLVKGEKVDDALTKAIAFPVFHEMGHALIDIYHLPAVGDSEVAADQFAAVILLEFLGETGKSVALAGAVSFSRIFGRGESMNRETLGDIHPLSRARALSLLCWVSGSETEEERENDNITKHRLPEDRYTNCPEEYQEIRRHWASLLANSTLKASLPH